MSRSGRSLLLYVGSEASRDLTSIAESYSTCLYRHLCFFFSSRRRHTRFDCDWSSDVCSSDLHVVRARYRAPGVLEGSGGRDRVGDPPARPLAHQAIDGGRVMKRALVAVVMVAALLASPMARSGAAGQAQCSSRAAVPVPPVYASTVARARALVCDKLAGRISGLQVAVGVDGKPGGSGGLRRRQVPP